MFLSQGVTFDAQAAGMILLGGTNDECSDAIMIELTSECSMSVFDASAATTSMAAATCSGSTSANADDVWFSFLATSASTRIVVEGTLTYDPVVEGFSGACGALVSMGCVDATFPTSQPTNTTETLTLGTTPGVQYHVRVYAYTQPAPTDHTFSLCIQALGSPANDECSAVQPIALIAGGTLSFSGDNTDCTDTEGLGLPQVWHAFSVTECLDVTIDLCGTSPAFLNWSERLYASCMLEDDGPRASSVEQSSCGDGNTTILFNNVGAGTYYFPVVKDVDPASQAVGPYALQVSGAIATAYCEATFTECDETIGRVMIGAIDNTTGCAVGGAVDHTDQVADIARQGSLGITVENGGVAYMDDSVSVFVDWDQDLSFCDADEVFVLSSNDDGATFNGEIICPETALLGATRIRVRMAYGAAARACGTDRFGEIEDYTMNVTLGNSIAENNRLNWAVFPNPNAGDMTMRFGAMDASVMIELFDVTGRMAHQERRQLANGQQVGLALSGLLAKGTYTLRLTSSEGRSEQRVVVQ